MLDIDIRRMNPGAYLDRVRRALPGYLGLGCDESSDKLQKAQQGTLFIDVQRRINMYLRALWGCDFTLQQTERDFENREGYKPFVQNQFIYLPNAYEDLAGAVTGLDRYRAASVHAAAHIVYRNRPLSTEPFDNWQIAVISAIEDARVERLTARRFPGLKPLWARQHTVTPEQGKTAGDYLNRLARALLDETYHDDDPWIAQGREWFDAADDELESTSRDIGLKLAHAFQERKIQFNPRTDLLNAPYRDDNRYLWEPRKSGFGKALDAGRETKQRVRKYASRFGMTNEAANESGDQYPKKISMLAAIFNFKLDIGAAELENKELVSAPFHYSEWDYQSQIERASWVTVLEKRPRTGDPGIISDIIEQHKRLIARMKFLLDAIQPEGVQRIRKLEDGDEIDINAAIRAQIDIKLGIPPDPRIMMSSVRRTRDISVLVLVDLSKSTTQRVQGQEHTVLQLTQQACVLLADAIDKVGDPFAIHGFCSDSRHHVEYYRFKDFEQPYNDEPKARIAGMSGQLSTRMGAAIRHAAYYLGMQKSGKKLLMVITDGEPADVDVRDRKYLRQDARKAVEEAGRGGIQTYCMSLDPSADQYVSRIFGARNYMVVDHVARLPEKLPMLYAGLTR